MYMNSKHFRFHFPIGFSFNISTICRLDFVFDLVLFILIFRQLIVYRTAARQCKFSVNCSHVNC